jgi:uncharacterized protein YoxC
MMVRVFLMLVLALVATNVMAQDNARSVREQSLQASRYELLLGKLQSQNEDLMGQVRSLQKANDALAKDVQAASAKAQNVSDEMQKLKNTQLQNISAAQKQLNDKVNNVSGKMPWGDSQRDCAEIGVKHQQIKVSMKPDGSRSVRFLCFDGKALLLGSEIYSAGE